MVYQAKTRPETGNVDAFLAQVEDPVKRADSHRLVELMQEVSGEPPVLWGGNIVGFGSYHYTYASGHDGDACLIGFSPRKADFSIYLMGTPEGAAPRDALLARLGKHRMGKGCLYIKRLDDIDIGVLRELAEVSIRTLRETHPAK